MKINEILSEHELNEMDRRGFLKGVGALAGTAVGNALGAPLNKRTTVDQMSGEKNTDFDIRSEDGRAKLELRLYPDPEKKMQGITILYLLSDTFDWFATNGAGRIKIGNNPPESITFNLQNARTASLGGGIYASDLPNKIANHKGSILIQVPTRKNGLEPIKFKID